MSIEINSNILILCVLNKLLWIFQFVYIHLDIKM